MKKVYIYILIALSVIVILFFGTNIFLIKYFNKSFYYTPNLVGYHVDEATRMIKGRGVGIKIAEKEFSKAPIGTIIFQDPIENQVIKKNRRISVWISKGASEDEFPDITGLKYIDAKSIIENSGYEIGNIFNIISEFPTGEVIATEPSAGNRILKKEKINILVSSDVEIIKAPDLVGLTFEEGKESLKKKSLLLGKIEYVTFEEMEPNIIIEASVLPKTDVIKGSSVDLKVSK